ncbi:hypothetical protein Pmani_002316 [Petrolisthes manimaculis]|uniref:Uncharacterized protein n=1 Tax=Petrolisthes manimaculis TaxID=1843537 RepID=A0AAE1UR42_9EUCA|nr:hypothetical protein Pmani_002316 [Petrolisthes manimaculis]
MTTTGTDHPDRDESRGYVKVTGEVPKQKADRRTGFSVNVFAMCFGSFPGASCPSPVLRVLPRCFVSFPGASCPSPVLRVLPRCFGSFPGASGPSPVIRVLPRCFGCFPGASGASPVLQGAVWWKESLRLPTPTSGLDWRIRRLRNIAPWPNLLKTSFSAFLPGLHNGHGHEWLGQYSVDITSIRFTEVLVDTPPSSTSPTPPISVSTSPQSPTPESSTAINQSHSAHLSLNLTSITNPRIINGCNGSGIKDTDTQCWLWGVDILVYVLPLLFTSVG